MAKLEAVSLHTLSPLVSKYTKFAITSDGGDICNTLTNVYHKMSIVWILIVI